MNSIGNLLLAIGNTDKLGGQVKVALLTLPQAMRSRNSRARARRIGQVRVVLPTDETAASTRAEMVNTLRLVSMSGRDKQTLHGELNEEPGGSNQLLLVESSDGLARARTLAGASTTSASRCVRSRRQSRLIKDSYRDNMEFFEIKTFILMAAVMIVVCCCC